MEPKKPKPQRTPRNILIAVDASRQSFEAVRYVGRILPAEGVRVTLCHIPNTTPDGFWNNDSIPCLQTLVAGFHASQAQQRQWVKEFMEQARDLLVGLGHPEDNLSVLMEEQDLGITRDIAKRAQGACDALVVGRKGMSDVQELILGNIAKKLVIDPSQANVWVIGGQPDPARIIIAMDSSEGASRSIEYVGEVFGGTHPDLLLLHVTAGVKLALSGQDNAIQGADWLKQAKKEFKRAEKVMATVFEDSVGRLVQRGADVSRIRTKIVPGVYSCAVAIIGEALEQGAGTIVMGRRGLSRVEDFSMGRVSNKVVQLARDMAVWVVH
jgi:nucleotide-binding universal stress UspA family protein